MKLDNTENEYSLRPKVPRASLLKWYMTSERGVGIGEQFDTKGKKAKAFKY